MLGTSTPFKIHDENDCVAPLTGGKMIANSAKKGLGGGIGGVFRDSSNINTAVKKSTGLNDVTKTPMAPKSARKALGDLSASHVNTQHRQMVSGININMVEGTEKRQAQSTTKKALSFKLAHDETNVAQDENIDVSDMICSQSKKQVDAYDAVMHDALKIDAILVHSMYCKESTQVEANPESERDWSGAFAPGDFMSDYCTDMEFPEFYLSSELPDCATDTHEG